MQFGTKIYSKMHKNYFVRTFYRLWLNQVLRHFFWKIKMVLIWFIQSDLFWKQRKKISWLWIVRDLFGKDYHSVYVCILIHFMCFIYIHIFYWNTVIVVCKVTPNFQWGFYIFFSHRDFFCLLFIALYWVPIALFFV